MSLFHVQIVMSVRTVLHVLSGLSSATCALSASFFLTVLTVSEMLFLFLIHGKM